MNHFELQPRLITNFELPKTLYHNTFACVDMIVQPQEPVVVGDVGNIELFTKHLNDPPPYIRSATFGKIDQFEDATIAVVERDGSSIEVGAAIPLQPGLASIATPKPFLHHADIIQKCIDYEFSLSPELFWTKTMLVSERILRLRDIARREEAIILNEVRTDRSKIYTSVHCDEDPSKRKDGENVKPLRHLYLASNKYSTGYLKQPDQHRTGTGGRRSFLIEGMYPYGCGFMYAPDEILQRPEGKIVFHNSVMPHFATLPTLNLWNRLGFGSEYPRALVTVEFVGSEESGLEGIYARNTEQQRPIIAARQVQLSLA